ncbi:MAG: DUF4157 domain-containing protein [Acidobacteriota bacterium]
MSSCEGTSEVPPIVHDVLRSPGQPLDASMRAFMEPRLGHDFSQVRVHTDTRAAESAGAVNALAYTVGRDVVFGAGQFAPSTIDGQRRLAHELTHVVQQRGASSGMQGNLRVGAANDHAEQEAHRAEQVVSAQPWRPASKVAWNQALQSVSPGGPTMSGVLRRRVNPNFVSCNPPTPAIAAVTGPNPVAVITAANTRAIEMLDSVIDELQGTRNSIVGGAEASFPTVSDGLATQLANRFHLDAGNRAIWTGRGEGTIDVLIRRLRGARQILNDGAMRYQCLGGANVNFTFGGVPCVGPGCGGQTRAVSCTGASRLVLCAPFWGDTADDQAATLMHECFHIYFGNIGDAGNLANAHCYEQLVFDFNGVAINPLFVGACP